MLSKENIKDILKIWKQFESSDKVILDNRGNEIREIDDSRTECIISLKKYIEEFINGELNVYEFKTSVDSFNKRNNLWGFTSIKGQMFFNQLAKNNDSEELTQILKRVIVEPTDLKQAMEKIEELYRYTYIKYEIAPDKRRVASPKSIGYFLSYFWQIHNNTIWPIQYTSLVESFRELGVWQDFSEPAQEYEYFFNLNEEIKKVLSSKSKRPISNWDAEHAIWKYHGNPNEKKGNEKSVNELVYSVARADPIMQALRTASFNVEEYIVPRVADLFELGQNIELSPAKKGTEYERKVAEAFKLLDFEVELLGQGTGRNPDMILRFTEENVAFIVDAKAYSKEYNLGVDDRAMREYINFYGPKLKKEGYRKIGFIIVSNSFKSDFDPFVQEITWSTEIRRFSLLTSEALLYMLAYKTKYKIDLTTLVDHFVSFGNPIESGDVVERFDDV
jgi:hypothetical protein